MVASGVQIILGQSSYKGQIQNFDRLWWILVKPSKIISRESLQPLEIAVEKDTNCKNSASLLKSSSDVVKTISLQIASQLNWVIRMSADMEMQMNAIERIEYYTNVEKEDYDGKL